MAGAGFLPNRAVRPRRRRRRGMLLGRAGLGRGRWLGLLFLAGRPGRGRGRSLVPLLLAGRSGIGRGRSLGLLLLAGRPEAKRSVDGRLLHIGFGRRRCLGCNSLLPLFLLNVVADGLALPIGFCLFDGFLHPLVLPIPDSHPCAQVDVHDKHEVPRQRKRDIRAHVVHKRLAFEVSLLGRHLTGFVSIQCPLHFRRVRMVPATTPNKSRV